MRARFLVEQIGAARENVPARPTDDDRAAHLRADERVVRAARLIRADAILFEHPLAFDARTPRVVRPEKSSHQARGRDARKRARAFATAGEIGGEAEIELAL